MTSVPYLTSKALLPFKQLVACFAFLLLAFASHSQVTLSLSSKETTDQTSVLAGDKYSVQLNYSVSSTTGNASGAKIVVALPDNIQGVSNFIGSSHAPISNFVFDNTPGAKKLTITFIDPLPSGSSGVLNFDIRTNNLITADGTVLTTVSQFTANGGYTSEPQTQTITVRASPKICAQKKLVSGGAIDNNMTYRISVQFDGGHNMFAGVGALGLTNLKITDILPSGVEFVSGKLYKAGGTYVSDGTNAGGVVTFNVPDMATAYHSTGGWGYTSYYADIVVKYNSPAFKDNDVVTNTASIKYSVPLAGITDATLTDGQTVGSCTSDLKETTILKNPSPTAALWKNLTSTPNSYPGNVIEYQWGFKNTGNVTLENVEIIEEIPSNLRVRLTSSYYTSIRTDSWAGYIEHGEYQTNLSNGWVVLPATGVNNFPLSLSAGEYYTKLKFVLKPLAAGASIIDYNVLYFISASEVTSPETATNCMSWNSTTAGIPTNRTACAAPVTLVPRPITSAINYNMWNDPGCENGTNMAIGTTVVFKGEASANQGYADAVNPVCAFFIPSGFKYVPGSETFTAITSGIAGQPTFEVVPSYIMLNGVMNDMYRYTFPAGTILPHGTRFQVTVSVKTTEKLTPGVLYEGAFLATAGNSSLNTPGHIGGPDFSDADDFDNDANTTEKFRPIYSNANSCRLSIRPSASIESVKWVKGQLNDDYSRYPAVSTTVPGGVADYRLVVKNTGNIALKGITMIDLFPRIGDTGVIDPSPRGSQWSPNLAAPIIAPAGITIYYTTVANPCRSEVGQPGSGPSYPQGCSNANWSTIPPQDLTKVAAIKIDFGTTTLGGGDSLAFSWPMRAPVNAPTNGEVAYNSFAFTATRVDNNQAFLSAEPTKVGIKLKPGEPAFIGDYVWNDFDKDGIQDANETGADGVVVNLMVPRTSGVRSPDTDSIAAFTITANGGKYLFSNLPAGEYYLLFVVPSSKLPSPKNSDGGYFNNDSDGELITYKGMKAAYTSILQLTDGTEDLTWDLGLYLDPSAATLPVRGLTLQVSLQENHSRVDWKVASESEVAYYQIERSFNGKDFDVVSSTFAPHSNNGNAASYNTKDDVSNIANTSVLYYRIKVSYVSGNLDYSNIATVKLSSSQKVNVWPNPAKDMVQIQMPSATIAKAVVNLSDLTGRKLSTYSFNLSKGNNQFTIADLGKFGSGIYILEIQYSNTKSVIKIKKD